MKIKELKYNNNVYTNINKINEILKAEKFYWLIDSELENAVIEIKNNTIIWYDGDYISGNWYYGIFKDGNFYGIWENGIWEGGNFSGTWKSGVNSIEI
jgi:hypothetical protein